MSLADVDYQIDRFFSALESKRAQPEEHPVKPRRVFDKLALAEQRELIRDLLRDDNSLLGEAVNESRLSASMLKAYTEGDLLEYAMLSDICIREYLGSIIQNRWDAE